MTVWIYANTNVPVLMVAERIADENEHRKTASSTPPNSGTWNMRNGRVTRSRL